MIDSISSSIKEFSENISPKSKVLDIGCGLKPYKHYFLHCDYCGIDVEKSGREPQFKKPDLFFDGINIPFNDEYFDAIICTQVLEHCCHPDALVSEMYRVLKKESLLLATVPFIWGEHEAPYDFRRYSTFGIQRVFSEANFKIVRLNKLSSGLEAIKALVSSEINNYNINIDKQNGNLFIKKAFKIIASILWRLQLILWSRLYVFNRIYIDNLIIVTKE